MQDERNQSGAAPDSPVVVKDLSLGYGREPILQHVNIEVAPGEIVVIAGGSGCGKSTLLKGMIGLLTPLEGRVWLDGVEISQADEKTLNTVRRRIGVAFQGGALYGSMTLAENVDLVLADAVRLDKKTRNTLVRLKLALVDLEGYEEYLPSEISGGMQKRAGLARAMALDPTILFFDEPSAGLDPITSAELDELILKLNKAMGTSMVVVTHELNSIYTIAHRVVMLDKSEKGVIAVGSPTDLRDKSNDPRVTNFFHRKPRN
ncbi:MAG: ATP-binding cassette domain-containing protein [Desulfarculaceae bacterium]|nr:ATP-binding cassette domain-containing protein [Desulfarculaceae bacterium]MCF8073871.1 ATP-binding cassette domain-containing protein [Desulfarculaceae bacterium]MCF8102851.1 ATP-binding cassette domain-containing protein [Desulfarculaceae bacterium]MCF8116295.1 ATP-binding cassette domain-containing protein [Desulfarculaceae bacterium]